MDSNGLQVNLVSAGGVATFVTAQGLGISMRVAFGDPHDVSGLFAEKAKRIQPIPFENEKVMLDCAATAAKLYADSGLAQYIVTCEYFSTEVKI